MAIIIECKSMFISNDDIANLRLFIEGINQHSYFKPHKVPKIISETNIVPKNIVEKIRNHLKISHQQESNLNKRIYFDFHILELIMLENSQIYKQVSALNNEFVDDTEFSFSSIGEEFNFEVDVEENRSPKTLMECEDSDLIFESSQNFY